MSCGHRCGLDLPLPWLWHSPAAVAPILPLPGEPPWAPGAPQKKKKKKKKKKKNHCIFLSLHSVAVAVSGNNVPNFFMMILMLEEMLFFYETEFLLHSTLHTLF